jgi:hypothetical protein
MGADEIQRRAMRLAESGTASDADVRELAYLIAKLAEQTNPPAAPAITP